jgi:hypothetical protein
MQAQLDAMRQETRVAATRALEESRKVEEERLKTEKTRAALVVAQRQVHFLSA